MEDLPDRIAKIKSEMRALRTIGSGYSYYKHYQQVPPTRVDSSTEDFEYDIEFVPDVGKNDKVFVELSLIAVAPSGSVSSVKATVTLGDRFKGRAKYGVVAHDRTVYATAVSNRTGQLIVNPY